MIAKLDSKMIDRLELYKKKNNELPERILVYRDGVSEVGRCSPAFLYLCISFVAGPVQARP